MALRIAFSGKARSGKDTAAEWCVERYGGVTLRFAQGVYEVGGLIQKYFGLEQKKDPALLQMIGLGLRGVYGDDVWVNALKSRIAGLPEDTNIYVADVRFPNEVLALQQLGFTVVRIERQDRPIDRDPNHPSETALDNYPFTHTIFNNSTISQFRDAVDTIVQVVRSRNLDAYSPGSAAMST